MSDHYTRSGTFAKGSLARGETVQSEFDSVETGFDGLEAEVDLCLRFTADDFAASPLTLSTTASNRQDKILGCDSAGTAFEFKTITDFSSVGSVAGDVGKYLTVDSNGDVALTTNITESGGNVTIANNATITGTSTHTGAATFNGTTDFNSTQTFDGASTFSAAATFTGAVTMSGATSVTGLDWELLSSVTASADEYITFAEVFSTTYVAYKVVWSEVKCTDDAKGILIQFGTGSTPTWIAGTNYTRMWNAVYGGSHFIGSDASNIAHGTSVSTGTDNDYERETGHLFVGGTHNSANNARLYFEVLRIGIDNADTHYMYHEMGSVVRSADITSIRFMSGDTGLTPAHDSGTPETIASGEFRVYGLRNA